MKNENTGLVGLEAMRANYPVVAAWLRAASGWSDAEVAELGEAVRRAVSKADHEAVAYWAGWLSSWVSTIQVLTAQVRAMEARVKADAADKRARELRRAA